VKKQDKFLLSRDKEEKENNTLVQQRHSKPEAKTLKESSTI